MRKWQIIGKAPDTRIPMSDDDIQSLLLKHRGIKSKKEVAQFLHPPDPYDLTAADVAIAAGSLKKAMSRIAKAIKTKESVVVYADYDADGITAGAIMWETLHALGANVMPYIPHRVEEGYGLSTLGLENIQKQYHPTLVVTVDHGITAHDKVVYARKLGMDVIVTDHHVKPKKLPECTIVHTTGMSGAGVSWFLAKELWKAGDMRNTPKEKEEMIALAAIGTIADMVPLVGANRSIVKYGLSALNTTNRIGLQALMSDAGLVKGNIGTFDVSHVLSPRLNAMGRLVHAIDALRLLCTRQQDKAIALAKKLGITNKERQQLTMETTAHALKMIEEKGQNTKETKLLFISSDSYNPGVIGLVAGKLVEEYYRPAVVVAAGKAVSKASARSIAGFDIVAAIRLCSDILVDVGGHPMAAGFTVETKHLGKLKERLEHIAQEALDENKLTRTLKIDLEIPFQQITMSLWQVLRTFEPYGFGNPQPVFATNGVTLMDARLVGLGNKHIRIKLEAAHLPFPLDAIAFGMGDMYSRIRPGDSVDIAYTLDRDSWNGNDKLQLKVKDIHTS